MPTTPLPGIGATMRTRIASIAIARSSASEAIFETLMPGPGRNSYIVTTGPGRISTTSPTMPKSASFARSFSAVVRKASLSSALRSGRSKSRTSSGGRVNCVRPPTNSNCSCSLCLLGFGGAFGSTMSGVRGSNARGGAGTMAPRAAEAVSTVAAAAGATAAATGGEGGVTISG